MTTIWRQAVCRWCGDELKHKRISKPRRFCSDGCRHAFWRADQAWRHGRKNVTEAEPRPFGYPIEIAEYHVTGDQIATRVDRRKGRNGPERKTT